MKGFEINKIIFVVEGVFMKIEKEEKVPLAIIPAIVLSLISIYSTINVINHINDTGLYGLPIAYYIYKIAPCVVYITFTIGLFLRNRKVLYISSVAWVLVEQILPILLLTYKGDLEFMKYNVSTDTTTILVFVIHIVSLIVLGFAVIKQFNKGLKTKLFYVVLLLNIISVILLVKNGDFSLNDLDFFKSGYAGILFSIIIVATYYWVLNPYKTGVKINDDNLENFKTTPKIVYILTIVQVLFTITSTISLLKLHENKVVRTFGKAVEEMDIEHLQIESEYIKTILQDLEFNGVKFELPLNLDKLDDDIEVVFSPFSDYENSQTALLQYNSEPISLVEISDNYIFEFSISDELALGNLLTINGVGINSTEEELLNKLPDYNTDAYIKTIKTLEDGSISKMYMYVDLEFDKGREDKEYIVFEVTNDTVTWIGIKNELGYKE